MQIGAGAAVTMWQGRLDSIAPVVGITAAVGTAGKSEAALAAEKAQSLMTEHNLSMANIEAAGGASASTSGCNDGSSGSPVKMLSMSRLSYVIACVRSGC